MAGEFNIHKFGTFLKSFWGLLASFTIILPTLIYFLNTRQVKASVLSDYYLGIPTTFALLSIPFVFLFENELSSLVKARKVAILLIILSMLTLFSFLVIKHMYVRNLAYSIQDPIRNSHTKISESDDGKILMEMYSSLSDKPVRQETATNIFELICLVLYTCSIILLTTSFSVLGVFYYTRISGN